MAESQRQESVVSGVGWGRRKGDPGTHFCIPHTWEKGIHAFTPPQWRPWVTLKRDAVSCGCGIHAWLQNVLRLARPMMLFLFGPWLDPLFFLQRSHCKRCICVEWLPLRQFASCNSKVDLNSLSSVLTLVVNVDSNNTVLPSQRVFNLSN